MESVKNFGKSLLAFLWGIVKRFWAVVPGFLLGGVDLIERKTGKGIDVSDTLFWVLLVLGVFVAALLTYHDLRMSRQKSAKGPELEIDELIDSSIDPSGLGDYHKIKIAKASNCEFKTDEPQPGSGEGSST